jgi:hypothetical protein
MRKLFKWVKDNPNRTMFLVPILLVAGISISHVVSWYDIANPISWAIYLSIAIEVAAMTALVAATNRIKGGVWFMFILVTIIQMIGNIFFSFKEIDANGDLFKSWVELTGPLWEMLGSDPGDVISQKRWLAFLEGGLLPIISLTSLHFFTKYDRNAPNGNEEVKEVPMITKPDENITEEEYSKIIDEFVKRQKEESEKIKYTPKEEDLEKLDEFLNNVGYDGPKKTETDESVKFTPSYEELKKIEDILLNQSKNIPQEEEIFTDNIEDIEKVKRALIDYNKEDINVNDDENEYVELSNPEPINKVLNYSKRDE